MFPKVVIGGKSKDTRKCLYVCKYCVTNEQNIHLTWIFAAMSRGNKRPTICIISAINSVALRDNGDPVVDSSSIAVKAC